MLNNWQYTLFCRFFKFFLSFFELNEISTIWVTAFFVFIHVYIKHKRQLYWLSLSVFVMYRPLNSKMLLLIAITHKYKQNTRVGGRWKEEQICDMACNGSYRTYVSSFRVYMTSFIICFVSDSVSFSLFSFYNDGKNWFAFSTKLLWIRKWIFVIHPSSN